MNQHHRRLSALLLMVLMFVTAACQEREPRKVNVRGRGGVRAVLSDAYMKDPSGSASATKCGSIAPSAGKAWGEVTSPNYNQFWTELFYLTWPTLGNLAQEDQLGYVSNRSGDSTGVRFWGNVSIYGQTVDPATSKLRIEIYDDRACTKRSDGLLQPIIPIQISQDIEGFIGVQHLGQYTFEFRDTIGTITLDGNIQGSMYVGTMYFSIPGYSGSLGQFKIPATGFFGNLF